MNTETEPGSGRSIGLSSIHDLMSLLEWMVIMQFSIPTKNGQKLIDDVTSRKDLRFAFIQLRKEGNDKNSVILKSVIDRYKTMVVTNET